MAAPDGGGDHSKEPIMPAYFDTGFSVRQPMWHGQGIVLDEYPVDWADARRKAGLTWEPIVRPTYTVVDAANVAGRPVLGTLGPDAGPLAGRFVVEDVDGREV